MILQTTGRVRRHCGSVLLLLASAIAASSSAATTWGGRLGDRDAAPSINAINIPIGGYMPQVGFGLTDEFKDDMDATFFFSDVSNTPSGSWLSATNTPYFDVALLDTGAQVVLLTDASTRAFDVAGNGFGGTSTIDVGGASGFLAATIQDPLGVYAAGLGDRTASGTALDMDPSAMQGVTSFAAISAPAESALPNVVGLPVISQYATAIRVDQPQIFEFDGATIRSPQINFLPPGTGAAGIGTDQQTVQRATLELRPGAAFLSPPFYLFNVLNVLDDLPLTDNPSTPSVIQGGLFLDVDITNAGESRQGMQFLFDTGASVTAVSQTIADQLGFDVLIDQPDFFVTVLGSGGLIEEIPGFIAEELELDVTGGTFVLNDVPIVVLDITDPGDPGNVVDGIIGTNLFVDRNLVIDPTPSVGGGGLGPSLYISQPVTKTRSWNAASASADWHATASWSEPGTPDVLWVVDLANTSGGNQEAVVTADSTVNRIAIGGANDATMALRVASGVKLVTFSGIDIKTGGALVVAEGGAVDTQFVDLAGGTVSGGGTIEAEFENRGGTVAPGTTVGQLTLSGTFAIRDGGTLAIELGGTAPGTEYDQLLVDGTALLGGTLDVSLVNLGGGLFQPEPGDLFEILTADEVSGQFDTLVLPEIADWQILYSLTSVQLQVEAIAILQGDMDVDGDVDFDDIAAFLVGLADPLAYVDQYGVPPELRGDLDQSGSLDTSDIPLFVAILNGGGPSAGVHAIPEPSFPALAITGLIAVCCLARTRRG